MSFSNTLGKFYGISVGPGDPELMTIKAVRTIGICPVLAVPRTRGEHTLALDIASRATDVAGKKILYLDFLMTGDARATEENHDRHAQQIADLLENGQSVGMLNLGDASLYSTFSYIAARVTAMGYEAVTIPGVPSFCACAAALNQSLTQMRLPLTILPASCEYMEEALDLPGGKVIMKPAHALGHIAGLLKEKELLEKTAAVMDCGLPTQRIYESVGEIDARDSYFTTFLIRP